MGRDVKTTYDPLADAQAIAALLSVRPVTVRTWAHRGRLTRRGRDARGRTLYSIEQAQELVRTAGHDAT